MQLIDSVGPADGQLVTVFGQPCGQPSFDLLLLIYADDNRAWRKVMAAYHRVYDSRHLLPITEISAGTLRSVIEYGPADGQLVTVFGQPCVVNPRSTCYYSFMRTTAGRR